MGWDGFNRQRWIEITSTTNEETVFKKHMQGVVVSSKIRYLQYLLTYAWNSCFQ